MQRDDTQNPWRPEDLGTVWSPTTSDRIEAGMTAERQRVADRAQRYGRHAEVPDHPEIWYS